jgi:hypothetical protein
MADLVRGNAVRAPSPPRRPPPDESGTLAAALPCPVVSAEAAPSQAAVTTVMSERHAASVIRGNPSLVRDPSPSPPAATGPAAGAPPEQPPGFAPGFRAPAASLQQSATPSVEEVAALVASGLTDAQLGRVFGRGDGWAYKFRRRHGIASARPRPAPRPDRAEIDAANRAYGVQPPSPLSEARLAAFFRGQRRRYEDVSAEELGRERRGEARGRSSRSPNVTAAVLGDPAPGRLARGEALRRRRCS